MTEYISTTEKIEKLTTLDPLIDKINELLEQNPGQVNHDDPIKFWIAGGAALSCITDSTIADYDIFCSNFHKMVERLNAKLGPSDEGHGLFYHFSIDNKLIQITTRHYETAATILDSFDFTIVSAAYDGETLTYHPRFWQDVATRTIVLANKRMPVYTLNRVIKYTGRGYTPAFETMSEIIRMLGSNNDG